MDTHPTKTTITTTNATDPNGNTTFPSFKTDNGLKNGKKATMADTTLDPTANSTARRNAKNRNECPPDDEIIAISSSTASINNVGVDIDEKKMVEIDLKSDAIDVNERDTSPATLNGADNDDSQGRMNETTGKRNESKTANSPTTDSGKTTSMQPLSTRATCISILPDINYPKTDRTSLPKSSSPSENGSTAPAKGNFVKRASISLSNMRRKSIEQVKLTFSAYKGMVLAMSSAMFFTLTAVIVKYLKDIHPGQMACFRFLGILLFTIPMIITAEVAPFGPRDKRHFLLLRGIAGATSLYLRYSALHYLPIANATVIVLSMPVFVCIFARIFLKEPCGIFHCIAIGITLVGIGFTAKISALVGLTSAEGVDKMQEIMGLVYSMGATLIGASVYIFVRKVKECHNSVILFNFAIVAIVETSILTGIDNGFTLPEGPWAPWLLMALAILSFYAQLLLTKALQLEEASLVSVTRASSEVVCAFIFQIIIFGQIPDLYACIGALLVTSSVLLTSARKWVVTLPSDHLGRKLLGFTLK